MLVWLQPGLSGIGPEYVMGSAVLGRGPLAAGAGHGVHRWASLPGLLRQPAIAFVTEFYSIVRVVVY